MIHVDEHSMIMRGRAEVICTEIERMLRAFRKNVTEAHDEKTADYIIDFIVSNAKKTEKQVEAEATKLAEEKKELFEAYKKRFSKEDELRHLMERIAKAIRGEDEE